MPFAGRLAPRLFGHPLRHAEQALVSYRERVEAKQKVEEKGHNHPAYEKCGPHCPRNEHYKGPEKNANPFMRKRR